MQFGSGTCQKPTTPKSIPSHYHYFVDGESRNQAFSSLSLILAVATMSQAIIGTDPSLTTADGLPDHIESTDAFSYGAGDILEEIWTSGSARSLLQCLLQFQPDGNLVIYSTMYVPQWASGTARDEEADYILALTEFGNLAIYGPVIWETNTGRDLDDGDAMLMQQQHRKVALRVPPRRRAGNVIRMLDVGRAV
ncbi:hypothetical protein ACLOJK_012607 [Asimina triloba]